MAKVQFTLAPTCENSSASSFRLAKALADGMKDLPETALSAGKENEGEKVGDLFRSSIMLKFSSMDDVGIFISKINTSEHAHLSFTDKYGQDVLEHEDGKVLAM